MDYSTMSIRDKTSLLFSEPRYVDPETVRFKINADFVRYNAPDECYRELMVSYFPMLPLLENTVKKSEADYILYMHMYARCEDMSDFVVNELKFIAEHRKEGAEIIVLGKAANAEKLLNGSISNITFWGDHFCEKLGKKFGFDIQEQYFVWDDFNQHLAIWPVDGCLQKCKFCRRSYMDIKFESLDLNTIEKNLSSIKATHPERLHTISLRAENLTEYGIDIYGKPMLHHLIDLLESYEEIKEIKIPIGFSIGECTTEILDSLCKSTKFKEIALNLEAGSNRMLKLIGKKHTREQAIYVYQMLREAHPNLYIQSTVMLGLPTEGLEDIYQLAELIGVTQPDYVLFNYYIMAPHHPLAKLPQLSNSLREYHLKTLLKWLRYTTQRNFEYECWRIDNKPNSRKSIRERQKLKEDNKKLAEIGFLPQHSSIEGYFVLNK